MNNEITIHIYADGGCRGNPGGLGGWGVFMQAGDNEKELWGGEPRTTSNRMELTAVIRALEAFSQPTSANVYTDSQYVQKGISEWIHNWKRNAWRTADKKPLKNVDLWQILDRLAQQHQIRWIWVKGHAGHVGNERADGLANRGMDELLARAR